MERIEYRTMDKSDWGPGEWQTEPDKIQFVDEATGLPCLIKRNHAGALCGYVGVTEGHPAYEKHYDEVDYRVHGGLTYSDFCTDGDEAHSICHVPDVGEPDKVWWLGFDCAHYMDVMPASAALTAKLGYRSALLDGTYRTVEYVTGEIAALAQQIRDDVPAISSEA